MDLHEQHPSSMQNSLSRLRHWHLSQIAATTFSDVSNVNQPENCVYVCVCLCAQPVTENTMDLCYKISLSWAAGGRCHMKPRHWLICRGRQMVAVTRSHAIGWFVVGGRWSLSHEATPLVDNSGHTMLEWGQHKPSCYVAVWCDGCL